MMMQGYNLEDVARGIDETMIRQPLGVVAAIVPFSFPGWFRSGSALRHRHRKYFRAETIRACAAHQRRAFELMEQTGLPKGVVNMINGGKAVVNACLIIPRCELLVLSDPRRWPGMFMRVPARTASVHSARRGKESRDRAARRRHENATQIIGDSAFGCAGQRCWPFRWRYHR